MTEEIDSGMPPEPAVKGRSSVSVVWLIPLVTLIIGGWLIVKTLSEQGPKIEVSFKTAEGIEAGKTKVKYKDIEIGLVDSVGFSRDFSHVVLKVSMNKGTEQFLGRGARFWVVRPTLSLRGASGLSTLISGSHIEIEPGKGEPQLRFEGLDNPPVVKADVAGTKFMLVTSKLNSIDRGSPIYFQGILAGEVLGWELGNDRKSIFIHSFVKAPYDNLVRSNTRFWNISGVDLSMGSDGVTLRTESLATLLYGGIAFETPESFKEVREDLKPDISGLAFTLYDNYQDIQAAAYIKKITCVMFFDSSVRGLKKEAPVEFQGIKVGRVKELRLIYDREGQTFKIPVLVEIEPERFLSDADMAEISPLSALEGLIEDGLRARLQTGSLLTGQLFIELDMHPGEPLKLAGKNLPYPELPTIPASLTQMTGSIKNILAKLERFNLDEIGSELINTLDGAGRVVNRADSVLEKADLEFAMEDFGRSLALLRQILTQVDQRVEPVAANLENAIGAGHQAMEKIQNTLALMDQALNPNAPLQYHFIELTSELSEMARSIRILVDMLERNPNSVIFGKTPPPDETKQP
ncbi:MAG: MlaD family protein [Desulfobacterales bacterium]|nr:MlaD family protein [Desulfobacterales bacterium]